MSGVLRCPAHHIMLRVAHALWLCDKCRYATGDMKYLKGVVEESFVLLERAGGVDQIRSAASKKRKAKREAAKRLQETTKELHDKYGYYKPVLFEPPTRVVGEGDRGHQ